MTDQVEMMADGKDEDLKHPDVIRRIIEKLRDAEDFEDNPSPYTPPEMISELLAKITVPKDKEVLVMFTLEMAVFLKELKYEHITIVTESNCRLTSAIASDMGCDYMLLSDVEESEMKFDLIVGNPPYQQKTEGNSKANAIWPKFVKVALRHSVDEGIIAMIHPPGWRGIGGRFKEIGKLMRLNLNFKWLSMHSEEDGRTTFKRSTPYDIYIAEKSKNSEPTVIRDLKGNESSVDISGMTFVPNFDVKFIKSLIDDTGKNTTEILHSYSYYDHRKKHMSLDNSKKHRLPVVRYIHKHTGEMDFYWSSLDKGHFGIPKVIFGAMARAGEPTIDETGEYGMSPFAAAIVDTPKNLPKVHQAMKSERFQEVMRAVKFNIQEWNMNVLGLFRKDFWKDFV